MEKQFGEILTGGGSLKGTPSEWPRTRTAWNTRRAGPTRMKLRGRLVQRPSGGLRILGRTREGGGRENAGNTTKTNGDRHGRANVNKIGKEGFYLDASQASRV